MNHTSISRRKILASVIGGGAATIAGLAVSTDPSRAFTNTTQLQTDTINDLVLDWRETYNGDTLTDTTTGTTTVSPDGPVISLGNVLPGDSGSLSVRLRIDTETTDGDPGPAVEPELTVSVEGSPQSPGIQDFVDVEVWYDTGLFGNGAVGSENGDRDPGERLVAPGASGTLGEVGAALADGVTLDASPTVPGTSCLGPDGSITVTFGWSFPLGQENVNAAQGDMAAFDIRFTATQC